MRSERKYSFRNSCGDLGEKRCTKAEAVVRKKRDRGGRGRRGGGERLMLTRKMEMAESGD